MDELDMDVLFPFLNGTKSESSDWWSPISLSQYKERTERMRWLSQHKVGRWLTYITMYDYLHIKVLQFWNEKEPLHETKKRVYRFFFSELGNNVKVVKEL
jgi:hypothetical protein